MSGCRPGTGEYPLLPPLTPSSPPPNPRTRSTSPRMRKSTDPEKPAAPLTVRHMTPARSRTGSELPQNRRGRSPVFQCANPVDGPFRGGGGGGGGRRRDQAEGTGKSAVGIRSANCQACGGAGLGAHVVFAWGLGAPLAPSMIVPIQIGMDGSADPYDPNFPSECEMRRRLCGGRPQSRSCLLPHSVPRNGSRSGRERQTRAGIVCTLQMEAVRRRVGCCIKELDAV